jgi:hypothetical protein
MIRKSGHRFSLATNAKGVCAEIMLNKKIERDDDSKKSHRAPAFRTGALDIAGQLRRLRGASSKRLLEMKTR